MNHLPDYTGRLVRHKFYREVIGIVLNQKNLSDGSFFVLPDMLEVFWFVKSNYVETIQSYYLFQDDIETYLKLI